jgi:hypothetical protein
MLTDDELLEARKRANEWRESLEEYCPQGGALFADDCTCPEHEETE